MSSQPSSRERAAQLSGLLAGPSRAPAALAPLAALAAAAVAACGEEPCGPATARVGRVLDGDTVELTDGERVRYLLVDAPELARADCFAAEALAANRALVAGRQLELTYDEVCRDSYGRLLAHVRVDGDDLAHTLVARGLARVLFLPPNGAARVDELRQVQAMARARRVGLWAACTAGGAP